MASVEVCNLDGEEVGSMDLPEAVFGIEPSADAIYYVIKAYLTNQRQGNASTKTRSEVNRSKRKMYRQKGTGRARKGTAGSPILIGGGWLMVPDRDIFGNGCPRRSKNWPYARHFRKKHSANPYLSWKILSLRCPKQGEWHT